jgi:SP family arabinose:H+ symporter-like MFS transporter
MTAHKQFNMNYIWKISLSAAMGGLLFGYDWVVIGGAKPFYEKFFHLHTSFQIGWAMSSALAGCLLGSLISGVLSERFGRKRLLIISGLLFTVSAFGTGFSNTYTVFVLFRIIGGTGIGLASTLSPMYIAEVSPSSVRGRFVSINQLTIVIGILAAQVINWLIAEPVPLNASNEFIRNSWNGQTGWRWMFIAEAVPALLFFMLMFLIPESPRWLVKNRQHTKAHTILDRIGSKTYADNTLRHIQETLKLQIQRLDFRVLREPNVLRILVVGIVLAVFQQWCGINVIFNYAEEVFSGAGYGVSDILFNIVITGTVNLIFTFIAIRTVDRWGRRFLMLFGAAGLAMIYVFLGIGYYTGSQGIHMLILVVLAIACYSMSLAPVTWVVISEIFPNRVRGAAMSIAVFSLWTACFVLTYTFPILNHNLGTASTFWIYAGICVLGFVFIKKRLPETKEKTLEEIEHVM